MPQFIDGIRADAVAGLDEKEKLELAAVLQPPPSEPPKSQLAELKKREFVKRWEMDDLAGSVAELHRPGGMADRDLKQGAQVFEQALCGKCHRVVRGGGDLGPELTDVTKRFSGHDILRSILAPSEVVAEKYQNTTVVDSQGRVTTGRVFAELGGKLVIGVNPFDLNAKTDVALDQVDERFPSLVSPMPSGLLDTFSKAEILDLLAYIDNAANEAKEKR